MAEARRPGWRVEVCRAGSRHSGPGTGGRRWRGARPGGTAEDLDDDHAAAAARAWRTRTRLRGRRGCFGLRRRRHAEQLPGPRDIGLAAGAGEQAVVADAVEALR